MSGILGIWNLDGQPVAAELLSRMSNTLAHRGPDGESHWIEGPMGLACQLLRVTPESRHETQPLVHPSGPVIVFDGRLDNRGELLGLLKGAWGAETDSPDSALALAAYEAFGDQVPEHLNGDFALALFDPRRRQILLARDALGIRPLYYCHTGDTYLFASEIKAILAHPQVSTRPNDDVIAEYVLGGPANQGETFFTGVFSLPPAHQAVLTPRGQVMRRYWDFDTTRQIRCRSLTEYAEAFQSIFAEAVRRRLRSAYPVAVQVSGGLDSSSVFCQAETLRRLATGRYPSLIGLTWSVDDGSIADEHLFIEAIEQAYDLQIQRLPLAPVRFIEDIQRMTWHEEVGIIELQWRDEIELIQAAQQKGARLLLTGHWGDQVLTDRDYLLDLFHRGRWGTVWKHLNALHYWNSDIKTPRLFSRLFVYDLMRYHLPEALVPPLRWLRSKLAPPMWDRPWYTAALHQRAIGPAVKPIADGKKYANLHIKGLYQVLRSRKEVLRMEMHNKWTAMEGMEIAFPMLDRDLIVFLMGVPGEVCNWQGVPRMLLRQALTGVLPRAVAERRWKSNFSLLVNTGMMQELPLLAQYLRPGLLGNKFGYVKEDQVFKEMRRLSTLISTCGTDCSISWAIAAVLALEVWLQVFFADNMMTERGGFNEAGIR